MESSTVLLLSSNTMYILVACVLVTFCLIVKEISVVKAKNNITNLKLNRKVSEQRRAPGPKRFPIIGNLISLDGYEVPYQAFDDLAKRFGPIISLQLGSIPTIVVNGIDNIKEVLIKKSDKFDSRPNFRRYHQLFCGNKENSLAFCDWSDIQKLRRDMLVQHTFPKSFSLRFKQLNVMISEQMENMLAEIQPHALTNSTVSVKPLILETCANIFIQYFCSRSFSRDNLKFQKMIKNFDKIFYEVNQGYAADFLPFLLPLHRKNLKELENWSHEIREFILENCIEDRLESWDDASSVSDEMDYIDSLIHHVKEKVAPAMEWETALFALEDMVGGHSAVGNFLVKVFGYLAQNPQVQMNIQEEVDRVVGDGGSVDLTDRSKMIYTEATIMEALRLIASPIVPHVANQDSTIAGYTVEKNTLIFLNNYDLSMSSQYWTEPEVFEPKRFLQSGRLIKPDFFLPFGAGRRSCMGYKMVQFISFATIASVLQKFTVKLPTASAIKVPVGSLAMPEKSYEFYFEQR